VPKKVAKEDKTWVEYFTKIRKVCPWSYNSMDKILVWESPHNCFNTIRKLYSSTKFEAFVYTFPEKSAEWLESQCVLLNDSALCEEWLWSHPDADSGDGNSTHIGCLIQQDKQKLSELREKIGYNDE